MLKNPALLFLLAFIFCFSGSFAQSQSKNRVYEFKILGMKTDADALKLANVMKAKLGIVKCTASFITQSVTVTVDPNVDYQMLRQVVLANGFEPIEDSLVVKDE
jgi:hypothetical protein